MIHRLFFVLFASSFLCPNVLAKDCNDEPGSINVYSCFSDQLVVSDKKISKLYKKLRASISAEHGAVLDRSQKAWLSYHNAECDLQFVADDPRRISPCRLQFNEDRLKQLQQLLEEDCNGCLPKK